MIALSLSFFISYLLRPMIVSTPAYSGLYGGRKISSIDRSSHLSFTALERCTERLSHNIAIS